MALKYTNTAPPATTLDTSESVPFRIPPCIPGQPALLTSAPQYILRDHQLLTAVGGKKELDSVLTIAAEEIHMT